MSDITTDKKEEKNEIADKEEAAKIKVEEKKTAEPSEESSILAPASKNIPATVFGLARFDIIH